MSCFYTMRAIKAANADAGHHWFEPGTMRFFSSRVGRTVYRGGLFISSEQFDSSSPRLYTVRLCKANGHIETIGEFQAYKSSAQAKAAIFALDTATLDALRDS